MRKLLIAPAALISMACGQSLDGTWRTDCYRTDVVYTTETYILTGDSFTHKSTKFLSSSCSSPVITFVAKGKIEYGDSVEANSEISKFDTTLATVTVTPEDESFAEYLNSDSFCDNRDWSEGKSFDVTGKTCGDISYSKSGTKRYDVFKLHSNKEKTWLYLGDYTGGADGTSEASRPTTLNSEIIFWKQ